jgi:hypothetical protein
MTRSKFSTKVVLLAAGIGLSTAAFAGLQPAAAQSYSGEYACPAGTVYDPTYGCTTAGADDFGYYDYPGGTVLYGRHGHGFGHMGIADGSIVHHGMGFDHSISAAHFGGGGFDHGMGRAVGVDRGFSAAHFGGGGFAHGMGVAHVGGFGGHGMGGGFHGGGGFGGGGHR